jgi:hypothetical protein
MCIERLDGYILTPPHTFEGSSAGTPVSGFIWQHYETHGPLPDKSGVPGGGDEMARLDLPCERNLLALSSERPMFELDRWLAGPLFQETRGQLHPVLRIYYSVTIL